MERPPDAACERDYDGDAAWEQERGEAGCQGTAEVHEQEQGGVWRALGEARWPEYGEARFQECRQLAWKEHHGNAVLWRDCAMLKCNYDNDVTFLF